MLSHGATLTEEANTASWEAAKGGLVGAAEWGVGAALLGAAGFFSSPIYRATTIQFKVYLQMSGMVLGGMVEENARMRRFERQVMMQKRWMRDKARMDQLKDELSARKK